MAAKVRPRIRRELALAAWIAGRADADRSRRWTHCGWPSIGVIRS